MFDGKIARMCKRTNEEKEFGIQLDSLADTVNFLCLPVIIMLSLGMNTVFDVIVYCLFILCGISRLGYFNVNASLDNPVKFYSGLPVTSTAIIYPLVGLLHGQIPIHIFQTVLIIATIITAMLFVLKVKVAARNQFFTITIFSCGTFSWYSRRRFFCAWKRRRSWMR